MGLQVVRVFDDVIIRAAGEWDLCTVAALDNALGRAEALAVAGGRVLLDFSGVEFCAVAAMNALHTAHQRCAAHRVELVVLGASPEITRHLRLAGLHDCLG